MPAKKVVLHVGSGPRVKGVSRLIKTFNLQEWNEICLDIDPANKPDIIGTMLDMTAVDTGSCDALYSSHSLEHVYPHEVSTVLKEFLRVLKPEGFAIITCPDLQEVCKLVAEGKLCVPAYDSPAGPITPLDILYGHIKSVAAGHHYMAHKCGFTMNDLREVLKTFGFNSVYCMQIPNRFELWALACKNDLPNAELKQLAKNFLPFYSE